MNQEYIVRKMLKEEAPMAIEWAANEGWNPGLHDLDCFWETDPDGWWIGTLNNEPVCLKSAIKYGTSFGFMGFYMVKPEYRGKGFGLQLWKIANESLNGRINGMDGVVEQQENYKKSGYVYKHRNVRYEGIGKNETEIKTELIPVDKVKFDMLEKYDRMCFPENRTTFLKKWVTLPDSYALAAIENDKMVGYSVIRKCRVGYKIGPLFADNYNVAEDLLNGLINKIEDNEPYYLDIPEPNEQAVRLVNNYKMKYVFETARMYSGGEPNIDLTKIFGITTFELG